MPGITLDAANYKGNVKTSAEMLTGSVKTSDTIKDTQAKDSFVRSIWFKVLTVGIGAAVLALYDLVNDPKREQKVADLKQGAKNLYGTLTDFVNGKVSENANGQRTRDVTMFGQTVTLMAGEGGMMYAKMAGEEDFTPLGKSAFDLRRHLTEDIFAHVDVFGEVVRELVQAMPTRPEDEISLEESHTRQICQGVIRTWAGVDAASLQNVTTANLADLAKTLVTQCNDPATADANGHTARQIAEERIAEFDKMISADRINSMDAQVLVDVLHADRKANEKVKFLSADPPPANGQGDAKPEVHTKGERDLVADFVLSQNVENLDKLDGLGPDVFSAHRQFVDNKMAEFKNDVQLVAQKKAELKQRLIDKAIASLAEQEARKGLDKAVSLVIQARDDEILEHGVEYANRLDELNKELEEVDKEVKVLKSQGVRGIWQASQKLAAVSDKKKEQARLAKVLAPIDRDVVKKELFEQRLKEKKEWILSGQKEWQAAEGLPEDERNAKLKVDLSAMGIQEPVYKENVFSYLKARERALGKDETTVDRMLEDRVMEEARAGFENGDADFNAKCQKAKWNASAQQFKAVVKDNRQAFIDLLLNPREMDESDDLLDQALNLLRSNGHVLKMFTLTVDDAELGQLKQAFGIKGDVQWAKRLENGMTCVNLADLMLKPGEDSEQNASGMRELLQGFLVARDQEAADAAEERPLRFWVQKAVDEFLTGENVKEISSTVYLLMSQVEKTVNKKIGDLQNKINTQVDSTFVSNRHAGDFSDMTINEMLEDAMQPSDGGYTEFVKNLLKGYLAEMPIVSKLKMVAAGIRYSKDGASDAEVLGAMLKGAGPLLQKVLQGLDAGQLGNSELAKAMQDMKSNLAPIPQEVVQAHLLDLVNRSGGEITRIDVVKSLGCASVAQTLECRVYGPEYPEAGEGVAVKIIRPDALPGILREREFVMRCARQAKMEESYAGQIKTILEEFDFVHEATNIKAGEVYNNGYKRLTAVKLNHHIEPVPGTIVMEKAPGSDVSRYMAQSRELRESCQLEFDNATTLEGKLAAMGKLKKHFDKVVQNQQDLCDLSAKWVTEGLYESGFFHGDLHAANIMLDGVKGVTLIDFGNVTQLTEKEKTGITRIAAAAAVPYGADNKAITTCVNNCVAGFKELLKSDAAKNLMDTPDVQNMIRTVLGKGQADDAGKRILVIISRLQRMGVDIPAPIFKFSQSQMRLQNTLEDFNDEVGKVASTLSGMLGLHHVHKVYAQLQLVNSYNTSLNSDDHKMVLPCKDLVDLFAKYDNDALAQAKQVYKVIMTELLDPCMDKSGDERADAFEAALRADGRVDKDLPLLLQFSQTQDKNLMQLMKNIVTNSKTDAEAKADTVTALVTVFINAEIELVKAYHEGCDPIANSQSFTDAGNLKTFPQCMGQVIKQNLVATSKRLSIELMQAIS